MHYHLVDLNVLLLFTYSGISSHSMLYSHINTIPPICRKPYTTSFIDAQGTTLGSNMYIKAYFLKQSHKTNLNNAQKKKKKKKKKQRMKIMTVSPRIQQKWKTMLGVIRNLILKFHSLHFYCIYEQVPYTCNISTWYSTKNTLCITWRSE